MMMFRWVVSLLFLRNTVASSQNEFLKEIITGRCYFNPPTGDVSNCPTLVGYVLSVLEGHLDGDIEPEFFENYVDVANFQPTKKGGLFWMKGSNDESSHWVPKGWNIPETTPGGALLVGLDFCGVDLRSDCPSSSGASESFWEAAYAAYAQDVDGDVFIIVEGGSNLNPLLKGAIPQLFLIPSVIIYASDCAIQEVDVISRVVLENSITYAGNVECVDSVEILMLLCQDPISHVCQFLRQPGNVPLAPNGNGLTPDNSPSPIPQEHAEPTVAPENTSTTGSPDTAAQSSDLETTSGSTYKVMFWLTLVMFSMGFYLTTRRQMTGYEEIPATTMQSSFPAKQ